MTVSNLPAGIHNISVRSLSGCTDIITVVINNTDINGQVTATGISAGCEGSGSYRIEVTGSISEIRVDGSEISGAGVYTASSGIHYVEYSDNAGCTGYDTFEIESVTPMSLSYASSEGYCWSTDLSLDVVISGGVAPYTINGNISETGIYTFTDIQSGQVVITVSDSAGCTEEFIFDLYIGNPLVISDTGVVDTICSGSVFNYTPLSNVEDSQISWTRISILGVDHKTGTGSISDTLISIFDEPVLVEYEYIISGPSGHSACYLSDTFIVRVLVYPAIELDLSHYPSDGSVVILGTPITIVSRTTPDVPINYRYLTGTGAAQLIFDINGGENEYKIYNFADGLVNTIDVTAINEYGCEVTGTETFEATYSLPNLITPKSPDGKNLKLLEGYDLQVFNRWGSELYRGKEGWDGRYKGTYVASGTYFYVLRYEQPDGKILIFKRNVFVKY
jgi:hypothetical protein